MHQNKITTDPGVPGRQPALGLPQPECSGGRVPLRPAREGARRAHGQLKPRGTGVPQRLIRALLKCMVYPGRPVGCSQGCMV